MQPGSLFSMVGCDNGRRTGAIGLVAYTFPGILALLFGSGHWLWLPGMLLAAIFGLSLMRRCRDAHRPRGYLVAALFPLPFWLLILSLAGNAALGLICFALGLGITLLVSVLPSRPVKDYVGGYWSEDMPVPEPAMPRREPVLGAATLGESFAGNPDYSGEEEATAVAAQFAPSTAAHITATVGNLRAHQSEARFFEEDDDQDCNGAREASGMSATREHLTPDTQQGIWSANRRSAEEPETEIEVRHSRDAEPHHQDTPIWQQFTQRRAESAGGYDDGLDDPEQDDYLAKPPSRPLRGWSDAFNGDGSLEVLMEAIYLHLKNWWRFYLSGAAALLLAAAVAAIGMRLGNNTDTPGEPTNSPQAVTAQTVIRLESGLELALESETLILSWHSGSSQSGIIWSLATAEGERHCASLLFNNGNRYRPVEVTAAGARREARFSPLDTQAIVRDIAFRGNVQLCGQGFSLKGSQALLEGNERLSELLVP